MTQANAWAVLIGALAPFLIAVINRPQFSALKRQIVAVVISLLIGLVTVVVTGAGDFTLSGALVTLTAVVGAAQATYTLLWKPTTLAPRLEVLTSPATGQHAATDLPVTGA